MSKEVKFCFILPCYEEHAYTLKEMLLKLATFKIDCIVVDDGSSPKYAEMIENICAEFSVELLKNEKNLGKGAAIKKAFFSASEKKLYTHAIQIDSDGQHDLETLPLLLKKSQQNPSSLISAKPIYDDTVPRTRLWGRYLTHIWVWVHTLSFKLKDSMCGVRSYPLEKTSEVLKKYKIGDRMDFDTEIMVKLYWENTPVLFVPMKVIYPENGKSYFDMIQDNVLITKMHTKLFFGMIKRLIPLLLRKRQNASWEKSPEKGVFFLIKFTLCLYDVLGKKITTALVHFISFYYFLFGFKARRYSKEYYSVYRKFLFNRNEKPKELSSYRHITNFSLSVLDKFLVWKNKLRENDFYSEDKHELEKLAEKKVGALFISSHYGNIEVARAMGKKISNVKQNALIYTKNARKFFEILNELDPKASQNIIATQKFGPEVGALLSEKAQKGEWIFCMGDRKTSGSEKSLFLSLLDHEIEVSKGPFLLSYLLEVPVYTFHCYKENGKYRIQIKEITPTIQRSRKKRDLFIENVAKNYAREVEGLILKDPGQWFNFYDYWEKQ